LCAVRFLFHAAVTTLKIVGDAFVSVLWCLNIYGATMAKIFLMLLSSVSGVQLCKVSRNWVQNPYLF